MLYRGVQKSSATHAEVALLTTVTRVVFLSYLSREGLTGGGMESVTITLEVGEKLA